MSVDVKKDVTGIILVGGKSRRMGRDKAFIEIGGRPLFERVLDVFRENFAEVLLVGDREERFGAYDVEVVPDLYPGSSLGGLYTGLSHAGTDYIFTSPCDLPFPSSAVVRHLCSLKDDFDVVVPVTSQGYEPLFAVYSRSCLLPIKTALEKGEFCAYGYYPSVRVRGVSIRELPGSDFDSRCFVNVNTPADVAEVGGSL